MLAREFGTGGPAIGVVGQGTWQLEQRPREAVRALRHGVELGLQHVDTAQLYGAGAVERLVGEALQGVRDRVFLVSKIDPVRATRHEARRACDESLTRLRTDRLDALLLHWLPPHDLAEAVDAMEDLVQSGRISRWGVSNFDEVKLEQAVALAGASKIACNQVLYHPAERAVEHAVLPCCQRHGIAAVGYSPFAAGAFPPDDSPAGRLLGEIAERAGHLAAAGGVGVSDPAAEHLRHSEGGLSAPRGGERGRGRRLALGCGADTGRTGVSPRSPALRRSHLVSNLARARDLQLAP